MIAAEEDLDAVRLLQGLTPDSLDRYDRQGPRYTSYPTVPEWSTEVGEKDFLASVREGAAARPDAPLSLYFHIPFCESRCRYCACNVIVSRRKEVADAYLTRLDWEMAILAGAMARAGRGPRPVSQIHLGGGTPNFLTSQQMEQLCTRVRSHFAVAGDAEMSLEANPGGTTNEFLDALARLGFNRISLGVQDFNPRTQEAIGRVQSIETTRRVTEHARSLGFEGVNYDLVYGLPYQTPTTFDATLDRVIGLRPDRVALYNFAFLPDRLPNQQSIDPAVVPKGSDKFRIFTRACERFFAAGYEYTGMDHFALPDDALSKARRDRTLQRNFMGYTTQAGTDLYAFGVSAISMTDTVYVQNVKKLSTYQESLETGRLPIERGIVLSRDDQLRRDVINELMCNGNLVKADLEGRYRIDFDSYFSAELEQLAPFEEDGLLVQTGASLELSLIGRIFVRNVAMTFDAYLRRPSGARQFSRTL